MIAGGSGCRPVAAPVFKTGEGRCRGVSGEFDSHPLPPAGAHPLGCPADRATGSTLTAHAAGLV